jgi:hypothetical protein
MPHPTWLAFRAVRPAVLTPTNSPSAAVDARETRVLTDFARRCPKGHVFATAMADLPLVTWRRLTERRHA